MVLVTGANGEVGHGLIQGLAAAGHKDIVAMDLQPLDEHLAPLCRQVFVGSILDRHLIKRIVSEYEVTEIYHLAALLSTRAEFTPEEAHEVNVEGTPRHSGMVLRSDSVLLLQPRTLGPPAQGHSRPLRAFIGKINRTPNLNKEGGANKRGA